MNSIKSVGNDGTVVDNSERYISNQKKSPGEFQINNSGGFDGNQSNESQHGIPEFDSQKIEDTIEDEASLPDIHMRDCSARGHSSNAM